MCKILTCEQGATCRCTNGRTSIVLPKQHAFASKPINVRSSNFLLTVTPQLSIPQVIGKYENNIGLGCEGLSSGQVKKETCNEERDRVLRDSTRNSQTHSIHLNNGIRKGKNRHNSVMASILDCLSVHCKFTDQIASCKSPGFVQSWENPGTIFLSRRLKGSFSSCVITVQSRINECLEPRTSAAGIQDEASDKDVAPVRWCFFSRKEKCNGPRSATELG